MNPQDPLAELRDISLPTAVSDWPPAPGWWLLCLLFIAMATVSIRWLRRRFPADRRAALRAIRQAQQDYLRNQDGQSFCARLSEVLRRFALQRYPREQVAGLSGERWQAFLLAHGQKSLAPADIATLLETPFQDRPPVPPKPELADVVSAWVRANGDKRG
ncbi:MAG: DUF4381 domain-containing protein [Chromatiales bacterium]|nr:DUF4381 domain-containing protein [Chromatiales bacterium]